MSDPVKVATQAITAGTFDHEDQLAQRVLTAIYEDGWRLVRTEPADLDESIGVHIDGRAYWMTEPPVVVIEEWRP